MNHQAQEIVLACCGLLVLVIIVGGGITTIVRSRNARYAARQASYLRFVKTVREAQDRMQTFWWEERLRLDQVELEFRIRQREREAQERRRKAGVAAAESLRAHRSRRKAQK